MGHVVVLVRIDHECDVAHVEGVVHLPEIVPLLPRILDDVEE